MRATKLVDNMGGLEYSERLKDLDLPTLAFQRFQGDMVENFKLFHKYERVSVCLTSRFSWVENHLYIS